MKTIQFTGFAGVQLTAELSGASEDPGILLLHDIGQSCSYWTDTAIALLQAGRQIFNLDLRGHGQSANAVAGGQDFDAYLADIRAVLGKLQKRPVIVAKGQSSAMAIAALGKESGTLAAGLVLLDPTYPETIDLIESASGISIPTLVIQNTKDADLHPAAAALPNAEFTALGELAADGSAQFHDRLNATLLSFLEQKHPREAVEFRSGSDARTLRDALGCFATGVTIITATGPDGVPIGLTANSFTSVSLDPPLLLVCIANNANSAEVLKSSDHFAVNVLQIGQQLTSNRFASKGDDRFAETSWTNGETGSPLLDGSLSIFECAKHAIHDGGDHFILVGHVLKASFEPHRDPLLYFRGKYRLLHFT
jgi:flavin reductase (DIM6/NTAB) family NADH-FMN oxidoreductase RutF